MVHSKVPGGPRNNTTAKFASQIKFFFQIQENKKIINPAAQPEALGGFGQVTKKKVFKIR